MSACTQRMFMCARLYCDCIILYKFALIDVIGVCFQMLSQKLYIEEIVFFDPLFSLLTSERFSFALSAIRYCLLTSLH